MFQKTTGQRNEDLSVWMREDVYLKERKGGGVKKLYGMEYAKRGVFKAFEAFLYREAHAVIFVEI